jgi:hypothetical protein
MIGSSSCLPAREAFPRSNSLLRFLSSRYTDECTGNGRPGSFECSATAGRLGLGLRSLEGDAPDRDNQPFLGLGQRRVPAEAACETVDCLAWRRDGCDFLVDGSRSRRRRQEKPYRTSKNFVAGARTRSCTASERISSQGLLAELRPRELSLRELSLRCYRSSTQVDEELVLEVLPHFRLRHLASES